MAQDDKHLTYGMLAEEGYEIPENVSRGDTLTQAQVDLLTGHEPTEDGATQTSSYGYYHQRKNGKLNTLKVFPHLDRRGTSAGIIALCLVAVLFVALSGGFNVKSSTTSSPGSTQSVTAPASSECGAFPKSARMSVETGHGTVTLSGTSCDPEITLHLKASDGGKTYKATGSGSGPVVLDTTDALGVKLSVTVSEKGIQDAIYG